MFKYGIDGIITALIKSKLLLLITLFIIVMSAGYLFKASQIEFIIIIIVSGVLMSLEMINTSIELICDFIEPDRNLKIKDIKDISAGAVLLFTILTFIIGCIIFIPKLLVYLC